MKYLKYFSAEMYRQVIKGNIVASGTSRSTELGRSTTLLLTVVSLKPANHIAVHCSGRIVPGSIIEDGVVIEVRMAPDQSGIPVRRQRMTESLGQSVRLTALDTLPAEVPVPLTEAEKGASSQVSHRIVLC